MQIPVSAGSIYNFNQKAYDRLEDFDRWILASSHPLHADKTGTNIGANETGCTVPPMPSSPFSTLTANEGVGGLWMNRLDCSTAISAKR